MADDLTLGAYWGPRRESARDCARRLRRYLASLTSIDDRLSNWHYGTEGPAKAGRRVDLASLDELEQLYLERIKRRDSDGSIIETLGFGLDIRNQLPKPDSIWLRTACGMFSDPAVGLWNSVIIGLPKELGGLAACAKMRQLVMVHVACWESPWVAVFGDRDRELRTRSFSTTNPRLGQMAYIAKSVGLPEAMPPAAHVEELDDGFFITTTTPTSSD